MKKAPQWGVYKNTPWGTRVLLGRVRANTKDAAWNIVRNARRFDGADEIVNLEELRKSGALR